MCNSSGRPDPGLYLVATPIGNREDFSPRARRIILSAALVACEDTRTTRKLFSREDRLPPLVALTEHNTVTQVPHLLEAAKDGVVVLVSEAGMPTIADPGTRVVEAAHEAGIAVRVVPGPSALTAALAASGFNASDVHFLGFLPRKAGERRDRVRIAASDAPTLAFFESPGRLSRTLAELVEWLEDPAVCVSREISKVHEEHLRGRASHLAHRFQEARGECVVVVQSPPPKQGANEEIAAYMGEMRRAGARRSAAAAEAARRFGCDRDTAYRLWEA